MRFWLIFFDLTYPIDLILYILISLKLHANPIQNDSHHLDQLNYIYEMFISIYILIKIQVQVHVRVKVPCSNSN